MSDTRDSRRRPRLAVVGSINLDLVVRVAQLPQPGQTVPGGDFQQLSGGKGANQAVAAARLGADVTMIGRVGDDAFGIRERQALGAESIDVRHVATTPGCGTGLAVIQVDRHGQNSIVVVPGANGHVSPADIQAAAPAIQAADMLLVQLEIPLAAVLQAIDIARQAHVPVLLDPAPAPAVCPELLLHVDYVCPNESEAAALTGLALSNLESAAAAARRLRQQGAGCAIITLGELGVWIDRPPDPPQQILSYPVTAVDATAAGDAFAAALAVGLAENRTLLSAVRWACAAGALTATRHGAQASLPNRSEVDRLADRRPQTPTAYPAVGDSRST